MSTGGLVVIGMFLLQWNTTESIERFEEVAGRTFGKRRTLLARALQLVIAYIEDGQYSLAAVQNAFSRTFNAPIQMFNPLATDTKVAVTTTTVDNAKPRLFTNYNGGQRPQGIGILVQSENVNTERNIGYDVVRAEDAQHDITVSDA